jgi:phage terminase large subunit GpA-like protein
MPAKNIILESFAPRFEKVQKMPPWEWADKHVNYSKAKNYDTPIKGKFSSTYMPFWNDVLEAIHDRDVREIAVLKCSRAGYSENLILTDLRYTIARSPCATMYVTATEELAIGFFERRIQRGIKLSKETQEKYTYAKVLRSEIRFADMDLKVTWAKSDAAQKQDGAQKLYIDEISLFTEQSIDMIRRRASAYRNASIVWGGSIDPTRKGNPEEDPILKLYEESDKQEWFMPDGKGGNLNLIWTV